MCIICVCFFNVVFFCRIKIQPNFQNSTTSGAETITLKPIEDTNIIIFHVNNITINKHSVVVKSKKLDSKPIEINDQDYIQGQKYRIHLNEHLKTGEEYQLDMTFNGELNRHLQGFYRSQYNDRLGNERQVSKKKMFALSRSRQLFKRVPYIIGCLHSLNINYIIN